MFAVIFFWIFFFIPDPVIEWVASRIGVAKNIGGKIFTVLTSGSIAITFGLFLIGDPLLYGNSKSSLYFKGEFPSKKLAEKFNIDLECATQLFMSYYDCWQYDSEPQHEFYLETTRVHYRCLFVFLLKPLISVLLFLAVLLLLLNIFYFETPKPAVVGQGIILFIMAFFVVLLISFNRLPSKRSPDPTGCWSEWRGRCLENYREFITACGEKVQSDFHKEMRDKLQDLRNRSI